MVKHAQADIPCIKVKSLKYKNTKFILWSNRINKINQLIIF